MLNIEAEEEEGKPCLEISFTYDHHAYRLGRDKSQLEEDFPDLRIEYSEIFQIVC